jgi:hypothetical protein
VVRGAPGAGVAVVQKLEQLVAAKLGHENTPPEQCTKPNSTHVKVYSSSARSEPPSLLIPAPRYSGTSGSISIYCRVFCTSTTPKKKEEKNKSRRSMIELEISKSEGIYIMKSLFELT